MDKVMQRIKDGRPCDPSSRTVTLVEAVNEIVTADLQYGGHAKYDDGGERITVSSTFMGCVDETVFSGTRAEIQMLTNLCRAWEVRRGSGVVDYLLMFMGIRREPAKYEWDDLMDCLELFLQGTPSAELNELLTPAKERPAVKLTPMPREWLDLAESLSADDGLGKLVRCLDAEQKLQQYAAQAS